MTNNAFCNQLDRPPPEPNYLELKRRGGKFLCVFGIYRSMHDFTQLARQLWHPYDELLNLPDELNYMPFYNFEG